MSKKVKKKPKPKKAKKMDSTDEKDPWYGWPENLKFHNKPPEVIKRKFEVEEEAEEEK